MVRSANFWGGYCAGLACEKWFVISGWPEQAMIPAAIASILAFGCIAVAAAKLDCETQ